MSETSAPTSRSAEIPEPSLAKDPAGDLLRRAAVDAPACPGLAARLGQYDVLRVLGQGGMGTVLLGRDRASGRKVAIKLLHPHLAGDQRLVQRFLNEARHMQKLSHSNILPVLEVVERPEGPYFVLPYMEGGSVAARIRKRTLHEAAEIARIALDVAQGLAYAHGRGITHRDLKPANILLDGQGRAAIADFGLGRTVFNEQVVDGRPDQAEGTPAYMAPELVEGQAGDTRCDTYALGATLYEMLTGRRPYEGDSPAEVMRQVRRGEPPPIRKLNPAADEGLSQISQWAMARELRDRYAHLGDVVADLRRWEQGRELRGPHGGLVTFLSRAVRSRRAIRAAQAALLVAAIVGVAAWYLRPPRLDVIVEFPFAEGTPEGGAVVADWEGDGVADLATLHRGKLTFHVPQTRQVLARNLGTPVDSVNHSLMLAADVDGDGRHELFVGLAQGDQLVVQMFNQVPFPLRTFQTAGAVHQYKGQTMQPGIFPVLICDLDGDGRRELLAFLCCGFGARPRGVCCFDLDSGAQKWRYEIGPDPNGLVAADLNNDGQLEVVIGSSAVGNHQDKQEGSDWFCSIYALDRYGRLLWRNQMEVYPCRTMPVVADLDGDGRDELYARVTAAPAQRPGGVGKIVAIDAGGRSGMVYDVGCELLSCQPAKLESGVTRLLVTDQRGFVHRLGAGLSAEGRTQLVKAERFSSELHLHACEDLDGDGRKELVFTAVQREQLPGHHEGLPERGLNRDEFHDAEVLITGADLRIQARKTVAKKWMFSPGHRVMVADFDGDGSREVLSLTDRAVFLKFRR